MSDLVKLNGWSYVRSDWTRDVWVRPSDVAVVDDESDRSEERTAVVMRSGHRVVVQGHADAVMKALGL